MTDPILKALTQISLRNRDAKFAGEDRLRDGVTVKRYVGLVDVPIVALSKRLTDAGVSWSEFRFAQETEGTGMYLSIYSQKGVDNFAALGQNRKDVLFYLLWISVLLFLVNKIWYDFILWFTNSLKIKIYRSH